MSIQNLSVVIVADNASSQFGGEAALPWHFFRTLRKRGLDARLLVQERTREQLEQEFPEDIDRIYFVSDRAIHRYLNAVSKWLPARIGGWTLGYVSRLLTQWEQRNMLKSLIAEQGIDVVHQPTPVSPKEPSLIFDLGVPVVIGPMNGGMAYPPAFRTQRSNGLIDLSISAGRLLARALNLLIPGKKKAATLLVANKRTYEALPVQSHSNVVYLPENGVDFSLWQDCRTPSVKGTSALVSKPVSGLDRSCSSKTRFVFVGRLVDWKAVDLLLSAFQQVRKHHSATLEIIGDGKEYSNLTTLARDLGLSVSSSKEDSDISIQGDVHFSGWLPQSQCAKRLQMSDVLVLPSLYECGGAVVLEAMATGLPAIATKWGGPMDYLDESCGILVEPTSPDAFVQGLADAMCELAKDPERRSAMGKAGRDRVQRYFDWDAKVSRILEIYKQATMSSLEKVPTPTKSGVRKSLFSNF